MTDQPGAGSPGPDPRPQAGLAISWAFDRFRRNAVPWLSLAAVVTVILFAQTVASKPIQIALLNCADPKSPGQVNACNASTGTSVLVTGVLFVLFSILAWLARIGVERAALQATQGVRPSFSQMLTTQYLGRYLVFTLLYAILVAAGIVLCIVPGMVVLFLLQLGQYYVLDKGYGPIQAARASVRAVTRNIGPALLLTVINMMVLVISGLLFGLVTLVALPFSCLFTAHLYRQFNHESVAPAAD